MQAEERKAKQDADDSLALTQGGKGSFKGKRRSVESMATDIYQRTIKSRFDVAMGAQFGGTVWRS